MKHKGRAVGIGIFLLAAVGAVLLSQPYPSPSVRQYVSFLQALGALLIVVEFVDGPISMENGLLKVGGPAVVFALALVLTPLNSAAVWLNPKDTPKPEMFKPEDGAPKVPTEASAVRSYTVTTETGMDEHGKTDAIILITLKGTKGTFGEFRLNAKGNDFEPGAKNQFHIPSVADLGNIREVIVRNAGSGKVSSNIDGWFLERITVSDDTGKTWRFPYHAWLDDKSGRKLEARIPVEAP